MPVGLRHSLDLDNLRAVNCDHIEVVQSKAPFEVAQRQTSGGWSAVKSASLSLYFRPLEVEVVAEVVQPHHVVLVAVGEEELLASLLLLDFLQRGLSEPVTADTWQGWKETRETAHHLCKVE